MADILAPVVHGGILKVRRGTAASWSAANPVLEPGEPGFETDTGRLKFGDGSTPWNSLTDASQTDVDAALATKAPLTRTINVQTNDYALVLGDAGKIVAMNKGTANTLTVPTNASVAFPVGTVIDVEQIGAGLTTVAAAGGVTVNALGGALALAGQFGTARLVKRATNTWDLSVAGGGSGASGPAGYDQIEVDFGGSLAEFVVPLTMDRATLAQWSGTMEAVTFEMTVHANDVMTLRWISSETDPRNCGFACLKARKVRAAAGAVVTNAVWTAAMNTPADITAGTHITFDTFDAATADLDQGADATQVKFKTEGTYRIYSEIDLNGLTP